MMKLIAIDFKPIDIKRQPIDAIGCEKAEPIAPIDNLLTGLRAIGLKRKYSKYIYIYKKQQPIDVFTPTPSREIYMALFMRTRVQARNSAMVPSPRFKT